MKTDRMEQSRMIADRALSRASNLFNCNGVHIADDRATHDLEVAYVANLFTIAAALRERAIKEEMV